ncbi:phage tail protein [Natrinema sp. 74]|uniref:phage tail protein n=1 Tax=Natrinema sp. 74 TaxID=3384159 RepID=UPI0038D49F12
MDFSYATTTSTSDWESWIRYNTGVRDGGIELATTVTIDESTVETDAVDVAMDPSGDLYTLRSPGALYRYDPSADLTQRIWTRSDDGADDPCALCVDDDRAFLVDGTDGSITVVSPRLQRTIGTIETDATDPIRIAHADGILYVLDATGRVRTVGRDDETDLTIDWWLVDPIDLTVGTDGRGYVLDRNGGDPLLRSFGGMDDPVDAQFPIASAEFVAADGEFSPTALSVIDDTLFVAGRLPDGGSALFERDPDSGSFRECHRFDRPCQTLVARPTTPDDRRELYAITGSNGQSRVLREKRRYARHSRRERHVGDALVRYDSGTDGTEWHRLALQLSQLTASTQVRVRYLATDQPRPRNAGIDSLEAIPDDVAAALYEDGVTSAWELATADADRLQSVDSDLHRSDGDTWQTAATDKLTAHAHADWTTVDSLHPDDVFLEDAVGRYLFVDLELDGSPRSSPRVESVTAFCPRQSYLRYLPELYQEDDRSAEFLERYLSVFESVFVDVETEIEQLGRYFDPDAVPSDALSWLEGWLAVETDGEWPEDARRELLSRAPELYKRRGTKAGLRAMLELYLRHADSEPSISRSALPDSDHDADISASNSNTPRATSDGGDGLVADTPSGHRLFFLTEGDLDCVDRDAVRRQYPLLESGPQSFAVFCGPFDTDDTRGAIETIVSSEKPAHVAADVVELDDTLTLNEDTFLGVNSRLTAREFSLGETTLGEDTVLVDQERPQ